MAEITLKNDRNKGENYKTNEEKRINRTTRKGEDKKEPERQCNKKGRKKTKSKQKRK